MKKFFLLAILVFITACTPKQQVLDSGDDKDLQVAQEERNVITQSEYEAQVHNALKAYWATGEVAGVKDSIVALTVPSQYLDVHFNLVVAFELLDQGQKQDDASKIKKGQEQLEELSKNYTWLK